MIEISVVLLVALSISAGFLLGIMSVAVALIAFGFWNANRQSTAIQEDIERAAEFADVLSGIASGVEA